MTSIDISTWQFLSLCFMQSAIISVAECPCRAGRKQLFVPSVYAKRDENSCVMPSVHAKFKRSNFGSCVSVRTLIITSGRALRPDESAIMPSPSGMIVRPTQAQPNMVGVNDDFYVMFVLTNR